MKYQKGYKYQLFEDEVFQTRITGFTVVEDYFTLDASGRLLIRKGYAWDGCSGPTWDDRTNLRASLRHDATYQMLRHGDLPESCRATADTEFGEMCVEDGMMHTRAWYYTKGVQWFGKSAAAKQEEKVFTAP